MWEMDSWEYGSGHGTQGETRRKRVGDGGGGARERDKVSAPFPPRGEGGELNPPGRPRGRPTTHPYWQGSQWALGRAGESRRKVVACSRTRRCGWPPEWSPRRCGETLRTVEACPISRRVRERPERLLRARRRLVMGWGPEASANLT